MNSSFGKKKPGIIKANQVEELGSIHIHPVKEFTPAQKKDSTAIATENVVASATQPPSVAAPQLNISAEKEKSLADIQKLETDMRENLETELAAFKDQQLKSIESEIIHDRRDNWINFLFGIGTYY